MVLTSENWKNAILSPSSTIQEAIHNLEETCLQIVLVVEDDGVLVGTVTDGDIRRGLIKGLTMEDMLDSIVFREPFVVPPKFNRDVALQLMRANSIHQLPVVDEKRRVVGLHILDELIIPEQRDNIMVIMVGGQGRRLRPHTDNCPKPLLPVAGKPMLEHIIERAKAEGFTKFILATHYLGHMIEEYFGDGHKWQISINYLREDMPLGTAGAIGLLEPEPEIPFIVTNGDVLTDIHYGELLDFHTTHNAIATMAVRLHEWQYPFGVVKTQGVDIVGFEEKPVTRNHINAGVYALSPIVFEHLEKQKYCDMPTLFSKLQEKNMRTIVYPMHEPWLDVGRPDDYRKANDKDELSVINGPK